MHCIDRPRVVAFALSLIFSCVIAAPAPARAPKKATPPAGEQPAEVETTTCEKPCAHVADCPKVTCECTDATASGVAACDADETHCCMPPATACERFCEVHHQAWTGRFTPEDAVAVTKGSAHATPSPACAEPCQKGEDCRTTTCQCARTAVENVAACDFEHHCCAPARVVCEHYCAEKKDRWTGKVVETPPAAGNLSDGLDDDEDGE